MKTATFYSFLFLFFFELHAQDYLIDFSSAGIGTSIDSVRVENITQGTALTLSGEDVLYLRDIVSNINTVVHTRENDIRLYPNPAAQYFLVEFDVSIQADYVVEIFDISGQLVAKTHAFLSQGRHSWQITGLTSGIYHIRIYSSENSYNGKIISLNPGKEMLQIDYLGQSGNIKPVNSLKSTRSLSQMQYNTGDRIKFTAYNGAYQTILTDIPTGNKTLTFEFADCTDGDNNTYTAVQIGSQLWMTENLRTTRYADGTKIPLVTKDSVWRYLTTPAYCWYNNDSAMFSRQYGALYNWFTFADGNLCPSDWHVPSRDEWTALVSYLADNGYGFEGNGDNYSKSLAAVSGWTSYEVPGTAGNNPSENNTSGFTALPAGYRYFDGTYKDMGISGNWWSFTGMEPDCFAFYWQLGYNSLQIYNYKIEREQGYSVRCMKD